MARQRVAVSWSGGKDSTLALAEVLRDDRYAVATLFCVMSDDDRTVTIHRVPEALVEAQAEALGLPLEVVAVPEQASQEIYAGRMKSALSALIERGISAIVHGDIFLEELRAYREANLAKAGLRGVFPLWGRDTRELADAFVAQGYRAITVSVDTKLLDAGFAGRELDSAFLGDLPADCDPCGENGEYHSFVFDGPIFSETVRFRKALPRLIDGQFQCCALSPESASRRA